MRAWGTIVVICSLGCEVPITNLCPSFTLERSFTTESIDRIDLLLVIDDSASMAEEQPRIADELAQLVRLLATGDSDGDGRADFTAFRGVRVGVVRTGMNGGGAAGCVGVEGTGVLVTMSARAGCPAAYPDRIFAFGPAHPSDADVSSDIACVTQVGTSGCGIEQPLSAMRAALDTPDFHRDDALLAVLIVTDEDDCSHTELLAGAMEDPRDGCHAETEGVAVYVDEILRYVPYPGLAVVSVIAGVPPDRRDLPYEDLLADPAMQEVLDGDALAPSCSNALGSATPPRRLVGWLSAARNAGMQTSVHSLCAPLVSDELLSVLLGRSLGPDTSPGLCLPRPLPRDPEGLVACEMTVLLPTEDDGVTPTRCAAAGPDFVLLEVTEHADGTRELCAVPQLLEPELALRERIGWGYDDSSVEALRRCESGVRLGISRLDSFHQVTFSVRCTQPLPERAPACEDAGATGP